MFIKGNDAWEIKNDVLSKLSEPGEKLYPCVELSLNSALFHLDIEIDSDVGGTFIQRMIFTEFDNVLEFIEQNNINKYNIAYQARRCDSENHEYVISDIIQILEGQEETGRSTKIYICQNGCRYMDVMAHQPEEEITNKKTIYKKFRVLENEDIY